MEEPKSLHTTAANVVLEVSDDAENIEPETLKIEENTKDNSEPVQSSLDKRTNSSESLDEIQNEKDTNTPNLSEPVDEAKHQKDCEIPLMLEPSFGIEVEGELPFKKSTQSIEKKNKTPGYLFPIQRMKKAWLKSTNICDFFLQAILIMFSTLGWFFCVGGVPFVSLVMLIIGSIYIDDCKVQPNIPIYLIVSGVFGTVQHVISIWTKYVPKESQGRMRVHRAYCRLIDLVITLFLTIWFVVGCVWIYGVREVEFEDIVKEEYCHKTLYYFAYWILNFSFLVLAFVLILSFLCILSVITTTKGEKDESI